MQSDQPKPIRKILILSANPKGTSPLRLSEEHRRIQDLLKQSDRRDEFKIHVEPAATIPHMMQALVEHKPEIVHICGHGVGTDGIIVCEDESSQIKLVPTTALSNLFKLVSSHVKCVVLNACFTEIQANEIVKHIEFVVGMKNAIGDDAALIFVKGFYTALFAGNEFIYCHQLGVNALQLYNIPEDLTPIIKMKKPVKKTGKKTVEPHPKILHKAPINSPEEKPAASSPLPNELALGNPNPGSNPPPPQLPVAKKHSLLRQMPKREFLSVFISVLSSIGFTSIVLTGTKRNEIAGNNVQANYQEKDQKGQEKTLAIGTKQPDIAGYYIQAQNDEENNKKDIEPTRAVFGEPCKTWEHIRRRKIRTTLVVFFDSKSEKWQAIETTFLKYYYVRDLKDSKTIYFIGSSKAEWKHEGPSTQGDKIRMDGVPTIGQCWLEEENLLGEEELIREIKEAVKKERNYIQYYYDGAKSIWSLDGDDLIREKWYKDQDLSKPGDRERFLRQF